MSGTVVDDGHPGMKNSPCAQEFTEFVICHRDRQDSNRGVCKCQERPGDGLYKQLDFSFLYFRIIFLFVLLALLIYQT